MKKIFHHVCKKIEILDKVMLFGSDGASTMLGHKSGVATRLKKLLNPFLFDIHCIAHRSALAAKEGSKTAKMCGNIDAVCNAISSYLHASAKGLHEFEALQKALGTDQNKMVQILSGFHNFNS